MRTPARPASEVAAPPRRSRPAGPWPMRCPARAPRPLRAGLRGPAPEDPPPPAPPRRSKSPTANRRTRSRRPRPSPHRRWRSSERATRTVVRGVALVEARRFAEVRPWLAGGAVLDVGAVAARRLAGVASPDGHRGDTHAPMGVPPGVGAHTRPPAPQSTRTSWPLKQPMEVFPSQRFAAPEHAGPCVAQSDVPSAAVWHFSPNAAQSRLASFPFSQWSRCVPEPEQRGLSPSLMSAPQGPSVQVAWPSRTRHSSLPREQSRTPTIWFCRHVSARPSTSQNPTGPCLPRPLHASGLAPRSAQLRRPAHELAWSAHSRIVSDALMPPTEVRSSV